MKNPLEKDNYKEELAKNKFSNGYRYFSHRLSALCLSKNKITESQFKYNILIKYYTYIRIFNIDKLTY